MLWKLPFSVIYKATIFLGMLLRQRLPGGLSIFHRSHSFFFVKRSQSLTYLLCEKRGLVRFKVNQEHVHRVSVAERGVREDAG